MTITSMRQWLEVLAEEKLLKVVSRATRSLQYELAALGKKADGRWALQFDHPEDFEMPVVTGIAGSRTLIARAMRVDVPCVSEHFFWAQSHPSPCEIVSGSCLCSRERGNHHRSRPWTVARAGTPRKGWRPLHHRRACGFQGPFHRRPERIDSSPASAGAGSAGNPDSAEASGPFLSCRRAGGESLGSSDRDRG